MLPHTVMCKFLVHICIPLKHTVRIAGSNGSYVLPVEKLVNLSRGCATCISSSRVRGVQFVLSLSMLLFLHMDAVSRGAVYQTIKASLIGTI